MSRRLRRFWHYWVGHPNNVRTGVSVTNKSALLMGRCCGQHVEVLVDFDKPRLRPTRGGARW